MHIVLASVIPAQCGNILVDEVLWEWVKTLLHTPHTVHVGRTTAKSAESLGMQPVDHRSGC